MAAARGLAARERPGRGAVSAGVRCVGRHAPSDDREIWREEAKSRVSGVASTRNATQRDNIAPSGGNELELGRIPPKELRLEFCLESIALGALLASQRKARGVDAPDQLYEPVDGREIAREHGLDLGVRRAAAFAGAGHVCLGEGFARA